VESRGVPSTEPVCEINRYLHQRPGRRSWWFRRRVPGELIGVIGRQEWRYTLKARNREDATTEAIPHLAETNETIELARRGDWPRMTIEEARALAKARFSKVCGAVDNEISAFTAAVGDGACAQLSHAMGMGAARWDRRHAVWWPA